MKQDKRKIVVPEAPVLAIANYAATSENDTVDFHLLY